MAYEPVLAVVNFKIMTNERLSVILAKYRTDGRLNEWQIDEFVRDIEEIENALDLCYSLIPDEASHPYLLIIKPIVFKDKKLEI